MTLNKYLIRFSLLSYYIISYYEWKIIYFTDFVKICIAAEYGLGWKYLIGATYKEYNNTAE